MVEDHPFSVCRGFTCGYFSFPSKKLHRSKTFDGEVQKFSAADPEDEPPNENVVQRKLHEYIGQFSFNFVPCLC